MEPITIKMARKKTKISIAKAEDEEEALTFVKAPDETLFLPKFWSFVGQVTSFINNDFYCDRFQI